MNTDQGYGKAKLRACASPKGIGIREYVVKPVVMHDLSKAIRKVVEKVDLKMRYILW